jgi:thiosulfate/3-mercaptopyruvate sulfurtransferase
MKAYARPELLASTDWLAENLGRSELRVVDVRWRPDGNGRQAYAAGHIPGATYLDWARDLVSEEDQGTLFLLAPPDQVADAMARAGVGDGHTVVLYDDSVSAFAARVWWSLRAYGFEAVRILDGGLPAWADERRDLSSATAPPPPASFRPRGQLRMRLTTADVRGLLGAPDVQLLDARSPSEYAGLEGNARLLGHIPGAINVPVAGMHRPGSQRFRDGDDLRSQLSKAGVVRGRRLVCYDGAGIGAAKLAFVLTLLGHEDVAVYDGGWAEWGDRLDLPVERQL